MILKAPFPWFGGKSRAAGLIWSRLGDVANYIEPFAGSLATLLNRPHSPRLETVNDLDCYLANFWRAVQRDPARVAHFADWPVNEADLRARHEWLVKRARFQERMKTEPHYFDAKVAGWWVWGLSQWIGSGWCSKPEWTGRAGGGRSRRGLNTVDNRHPHLTSVNGVQKRPVLRSARGQYSQSELIREWMEALSNRLRAVRVCCGEWNRILTPACTTKIGGGARVTGVLLDPPYDLRIVRKAGDGAAHSDKLYAHHDNDLSAKVRDWAIENGSNPLLRIALCGVANEHAMPSEWETAVWTPGRGYAKQRLSETIWFSPHCLKQANLFEEIAQEKEAATA